MEESFYQSGQLWIREFFQNGKRDGERKVWYRNGQIFVSSFYRSGNPEGIHIGWHENGSPGMRDFYRNGRVDGECKFWGRDGRAYSHFYRDGKLINTNFSINKKRMLVKMKNKSEIWRCF